MKIVKTIVAMQRMARDWQRKGTKVALVPTMGYLHAGHASLIINARRQVGRRGVVVVSIFVNPTQFAPTEDLAKYPRDLKRDTAICRESGADYIFFPTAAATYPPDFSTWVTEEKLSQGMESATRPTHFRGVTTVVAKLFQIVSPNYAIFGAKDFQQSAIVQRMVRDLNFPLKVIICPTVREPDGLAMSSRNRYLSAAQRRQATVLTRAIVAARAKIRRGPVPCKELWREARALIGSEPEARLDYISFFDAKTLQPVEMAKRGTHMALAVYIGQTRLIDNAAL